MLGSKISNALENNSFVALMLLKLRRLRKIGESKEGLDYRIGNKIMCSLKG